MGPGSSDYQVVVEGSSTQFPVDYNADQVYSLFSTTESHFVFLLVFFTTKVGNMGCLSVCKGWYTWTLHAVCPMVPSVKTEWGGVVFPPFFCCGGFANGDG